MECTICWDKFEDSAVSLNCGHLFHRKCIEPLVNTLARDLVCPFCRKGDPTSAYRLSSSLKSSQESSDPPIVFPNYMREVFFISAASTSDSLAIGENASWEDPMMTIARLRQQNTYLLADKLKEPERLMALATTLGDKAIEASTTAMEKISKVFEAKLYEFDSERRRWEKREKSSEKEVALLETELDEVQQERDNLKKTIRKLKANITNV